MKKPVSWAMIQDRQISTAEKLPLPPVSVVEEAMVTVAANRQLLSYREAAVGACLWSEGGSSHFLALLLSGKVETLKKTEFPRRPFVTGLFGVGAIVGEAGFLNDLPCNSPARVLEPRTILTLTREKYEQLEQLYPAVANLVLKWILNTVSSRLHNAQKRLATIF